MIMKEISNDLKCVLTCLQKEVKGIAEVPAERNVLEEQQSSANKKSEATTKSLQDTVGRIAKENEKLHAKIANPEEQQQSKKESVKKIINSLKEAVDRISSENRMLHPRIEDLEKKHCGKRETIRTDKVVKVTSTSRHKEADKNHGVSDHLEGQDLQGSHDCGKACEEDQLKAEDQNQTLNMPLTDETPVHTCKDTKMSRPSAGPSCRLPQLDDFSPLKLIRKGHFGEVYLVRKESGCCTWCMKWRNWCSVLTCRYI
jgi:hypothetical protein